jgi:hypothetical protein
MNLSMELLLLARESPLHFQPGLRCEIRDQVGEGTFGRSLHFSTSNSEALASELFKNIARLLLPTCVLDCVPRLRGINSGHLRLISPQRDLMFSEVYNKLHTSICSRIGRIRNESNE